MKVKLIVAMDVNRGIGKNNDLPWHLPADMKFFKETTQGQVVIMGRKNYESIPEKYRPLPNRTNVVLTKQKGFEAPNCYVCHTLEDCLIFCYGRDFSEVWIIGGGEIYREALMKNLVDEMYITEVMETFEADVFFPKFDDSKWHCKVIASQEPDEKNAHAFRIKHCLKK